MMDSIADAQLRRFRDDYLVQVNRALTLRDHSWSNPPRFRLPDWTTWAFSPSYLRTYGASADTATAATALNALGQRYGEYVPWAARGELEAILRGVDPRPGLGSTGGPATQDISSSSRAAPSSSTSSKSWLLPAAALAALLAFGRRR